LWVQFPPSPTHFQKDFIMASTTRNIEAARGLMRQVRWVSNLIGPAKTEFRRTLMLHLTGERLPLSKCGYNAVAKALATEIGYPTDQTHSYRFDDAVGAWIGNPEGDGG